MRSVRSRRLKMTDAVGFVLRLLGVTGLLVLGAVCLLIASYPESESLAVGKLLGRAESGPHLRLEVVGVVLIVGAVLLAVIWAYRRLGTARTRVSDLDSVFSECARGSTSQPERVLGNREVEACVTTRVPLGELSARWGRPGFVDTSTLGVASPGKE